jgi:hypothetical protein
MYARAHKRINREVKVGRLQSGKKQASFRRKRGGKFLGPNFFSISAVTNGGSGGSSFYNGVLLDTVYLGLLL